MQTQTLAAYNINESIDENKLV